MVRLPQVIRNVAVADANGLQGSAPVWEEVRSVEGQLGADGRVLVRASGTEKLVRVMVEATTLEEAESYSARLGDVVAAALGGPPPTG
jgi:phosphoglucosamine mutase